jgi:hypothetical protein
MRTISRAKRSAAWACSARWSLVPRSHLHDCTTSAHHHAGTTGLRWNHTQHTITLRTTGKQHHERSYHTCTTSTQQHGRSYHFCTTSTRTPERGTTGVAESRLIPIGNGLPTTFPSGRTGCPSAAASAPQKNVKMRTILRAKRSVAWACWATDSEQLIRSDHGWSIAAISHRS